MSASVVIGQANFSGGSANQGGSATASSLSGPSVFTDGTKLIVPDFTNNRVLIFNKIPTANTPSADVVIGQSDFTSSTANQGGSASSQTLNQPAKAYIHSGKLFISDFTNNRVLIYNSIPTTNNASADVVIGQPDMTTTSSGTTASKLKTPDGIFVDQATGKLFIVDRGNVRVLIYNQIPTTNGAAADVVMGQSNFTSSSTGTTSSTFSSPRGVLIANGKMLVGDNTNNRVLIWNSIPTTNGVAADVVMGQSNFTSGSANQGGSPAANTVSGPGGGLWFDGQRLYVTDGSNYRILIFNNGIPTSNNASADIALGQSDLSSNTLYLAGSLGKNTVRPNSLQVFGNKLFASEFSNNRILIYDNITVPPSITLSPSLLPGDSGKMRMKGTASLSATDHNEYLIKSVDVSVNGGLFGRATPSDGSFGGVSEDFYLDFDPGDNGNSEDGYTLNVKATTTNIDVTDHAFFFSPFRLLHPDERETVSSLPTFSFLINHGRFSDLRDHLKEFQIWVQHAGGAWQTYVDQIPVDYESIKNNGDNTNRTEFDTHGNGTYENTKMMVTYSGGNQTIKVTPKPDVDPSSGFASSAFFDPKDPKGSGKFLVSGVYQWKVVAVSTSGTSQETETRTMVIGHEWGGGGDKGSILRSQAWFPLTVETISGKPFGLSSLHPEEQRKTITIGSTTPSFSGIAFSGSIFTATISDQSCLRSPPHGDSSLCRKTVETQTGENSRYVLVMPGGMLEKGKTYGVVFSVWDTGDNRTVLPEASIKVVKTSQRTGEIGAVESASSVRGNLQTTRDVPPAVLSPTPVSTPGPKVTSYQEPIPKKFCLLWWCW